ncbi:hypothetical protein BDN67DRAFT_1006953 [Paxillus ammoniavirescens]|nr:hypothetical protein BDN67DRAFT_1006953 [Paxillus ammoniavirescens]
MTATHGVERIPFPASAKVYHLTSDYLDQVTRERIEILSREGRRVVGLPVILNDGIVMHWVRVKLDSSHDQSGETSDTSGTLVWMQKDDSNSPAVPPSVNIAPHQGLKKTRLPLARTTGGFGATEADAIIIDSDEDRSENACASRDSVQRAAPFNRQEVHSHSDSDIEFISWIQHARPGDKSEDSVNDLISSCDTATPELQPEDLPRAISVGAPHGPTAQSNRDNAAAALCGEGAPLYPDNTEATTSELEDGADRRGYDIEDTDIVQRSIQDNSLSRLPIQGPAVHPGRLGIAPRSHKPPSLPSLEPIRDLLARTKRVEDSLSRSRRRDPPSKRPAVAKTVPLRNLARRDSSESANSSTSSDSDDDVGGQPSEAQCKRVPLPKTDYGRSRRLLIPESTHLPLVAVTMRGDCHFIERKKKFRITGYSLPNSGVFRHVDDVCVVGDTVVLGCDKGPHQISFLPVSARPQMVDVARSPHNSGPRYQGTPNRGISCLAAMHAEADRIKFFSGGHDGTVHRWTANATELNDPRSEKVVSHGSCISALAYRRHNTSLLSSAQRTLHITDLNRCKTESYPFSDEIQQIHVHPQAAYVTLLEVRHLDRQILLFDSRKGGFDREPCLSFGYRDSDAKFSPSHTRGSAHLVHFARGSKDGSVLLWDFRNSKEAVVGKRYQQAEKVVHTIFAGTDIATFGQGVVTFFENYLAH